MIQKNRRPTCRRRKGVLLKPQHSLPIPQAFRDQPQWFTSPRLLRVGEQIVFHLFLPAGMSGGTLEIFPGYLERANWKSPFTSENGLGWLNSQKPERWPLTFKAGWSSLVYRPRRPGNYLARWRAGDETLHRYFSVIEDDSVVINFATFFVLDPQPSLHATGIPLESLNLQIWCKRIKF